MAQIRLGGPDGVTRPFRPGIGIIDAQFQQAEALDHIARALSAIDHNLEQLVDEVRKLRKQSEKR